ncbi:glycoside hydrolase [Candidatus Hydrogenedentota bacterium]
MDPNIAHQTIEGWGAASCFVEESLVGLPGDKRDEVCDLIFKDLGATMLRVRVYADFQPTEGADYNWDCMADQRLIIGEALSRGVVDKVWAATWSPPGWMKANGDSRNGGRLKPGHYRGFAAYLADYVKGMRDRYNIEIEAISAFNEPGASDVYETAEMSGEEYFDFLKVMGERFKEREKLKTRIVGPDTMNINGSTLGCLGGGFLERVFSDSRVSEYLDTVITHQYGKRGPDRLPDLRDLLKANGKQWWQTELCRLDGTTEDIDEGLETALWIWRDVVRGDAAAWHYWQYYWPREEGASGLVILIPGEGYVVPPRYYCFKHWSKHVLPGAVRIEAKCTSPDLHIAAFQHDKNLTLIAINKTDADIPAVFESGKIRGKVKHVRTSARETYAVQPELVTTKGGFAAIIQAKSINTFDARLP